MLTATVQRALKAEYGRLLGRLRWLEKPPKTMSRKWRGGQAFQAQEPLRREEAARLTEALLHLGYVIRLAEADWDDATVKIVRPNSGWSRAASRSFVEEAWRVLDDEVHYITMSEIADEVAGRLSISMDDVASRQRLHTTINNGLMARRDLLHDDGGTPRAWALARKVNEARLSDGDGASP